MRGFFIPLTSEHIVFVFEYWVFEFLLHNILRFYLTDEICWIFFDWAKETFSSLSKYFEDYCFRNGYWMRYQSDYWMKKKNKMLEWPSIKWLMVELPKKQLNEYHLIRTCLQYSTMTVLRHVTASWLRFISFSISNTIEEKFYVKESTIWYVVCVSNLLFIIIENIWKFERIVLFIWNLMTKWMQLIVNGRVSI